MGLKSQANQLVLDSSCFRDAERRQHFSLKEDKQNATGSHSVERVLVITDTVSQLITAY